MTDHKTQAQDSAARAASWGRAVLGCLLESPDLWPEAAELSVDDFVFDDHRKIFRGIASLHEHNCNADIVSVYNELGDDVPAGSLAALVDGAVPANFKHYVTRLRECSRNRQFQVQHRQLGEAKTAEDRLSLLGSLRNSLEAVISPLEKPIRRLDDIPPFHELDIKPVQYIIPGLIARGTINMICGKPGCAKSYLALVLAVSVAAGRTFLGRQCQQAMVLFLDYENPDWLIRDRLETIHPEPLTGLKIWPTSTAIQKQPRLGSSLLLELAKERPLIIVDSFRASHAAKENDGDEMQAIMDYLRDLVRAGATVLLLHHVAKAEGSTFRGSSAIEAAGDWTWLQTQDPETGLLTLSNEATKSRTHKTKITIRPDFESGTMEVIDSPEFTQRTQDVQRIAEFIADHPGESQNYIAKNCAMRRQRVIGLLKEGVGVQWKIERGANKSVRYFPIDERFPKSPEPLGTTGNHLGEQVSGSGGSTLKGEEPRNHSLTNCSQAPELPRPNRAVIL